jgi:hypothetical protein
MESTPIIMDNLHFNAQKTVYFSYEEQTCNAVWLLYSEYDTNTTCEQGQGTVTSEGI